jgi:hypothetical protein
VHAPINLPQLGSVVGYSNVAEVTLRPSTTGFALPRAGSLVHRMYWTWRTKTDPHGIRPEAALMFTEHVLPLEVPAASEV